MEYRIAKVHIEGSKWVVESQIFFNGEPLAWEESGGNLTEEWFSEQWIFMDGDWWPDPLTASQDCASPGNGPGSAAA